VSSFKTEIPVHLDRVQKLMPPGAVIDDVKVSKDRSCLELTWHTSALKTKYLWATPFSIEQLEKRELPEGVEDPTIPAKGLPVGDASAQIETKQGPSLPPPPVESVIERVQAGLGNPLGGPKPLPQPIDLTKKAIGAKTPEDAKLAGKTPSKKTKPRRVHSRLPAASTPAVDGERSATTGGVSAKSGGAEVNDDAQGSGVQKPA